MKILFEIGLGPHIRHYDNVIEVLKQRGHEVVVTASLEDNSFFEKKLIDKDHRNVISNILFFVRESWAEQMYLFRCTRDYIHYLRPEFNKSAILRGRIQNMLRYGFSEAYAEAGSVIEKFVLSLTREQQQQFSKVLGSIEKAMPASKKLESLFLKYKPDIYLITPLIFTQYSQFELFKSAKSLGIPVGYMVFSWDNISTKGVLHLEPDAIFLWNKIQEEELAKFYGITANIYKCGAPRFDYFFEKKPSLTKEDFYRRNKLNIARPTVTYLCSSNLISSAETEFVTKWLTMMNSAQDKVMKTCNIIIRPHPKFISLLDNVDFGKSERCIAIIASERLNNDQLLFDTLYFSSAVVGLNTSAQLESAVLGKPVLTIQVPEYSEGQTGTIHFHYLLKENGGFVDRAESLETHAQQLLAVLRNQYDPQLIQNFVSMFIRPQGLEKPASVATAEAIESFYQNCKKKGRKFIRKGELANSIKNTNNLFELTWKAIKKLSQFR